jgi:hypothetical protein
MATKQVSMSFDSLDSILIKKNHFKDYHWWWRSFLTSGFTAVYLFIYCVHYFVTKLEIEGAASTFLYFGYTSIMVFTFFLLTGIILFSKKEKLAFCLTAPHPLFCRNNWLLRLLLVHQKNLQRSQSRLELCEFVNPVIAKAFLRRTTKTANLKSMYIVARVIILHISKQPLHPLSSI